MARRYHGPQMRTTAELLTILLEEWWLMPPDLARLVRGALLASRFSRAVDLEATLRRPDQHPHRPGRLFLEHLYPGIHHEPDG
jgi:hypothetical protein